MCDNSTVSVNDQWIFYNNYWSTNINFLINLISVLNSHRIRLTFVTPVCLYTPIRLYVIPGSEVHM